MIVNAPTGLPWSVVPWPKATAAEQLAEQTNVCWRATGEVDRLCNQPLRATLDVEEEVGPDYRVTVDNTGVVTLLASRWPIISIIGGQYSPADVIPPNWITIPGTAMRPSAQISSVYGTTAPGASADGPSMIDISPGYVSWWNGRRGHRLQVSYVNGWPHAALLATAAAGATSLRVDDVTGMAGARCWLYDGANTEMVTVNSVTADAPATVMGTSVPVGPGTATLTTPLASSHAAGIVCSAIPQDISWATILLASSEVLDSGASAMLMQSVSGSETIGGKGAEDLRRQAKKILEAYGRVI